MHAAQDRRDFRRATTDPQWGKDRGDDNVANSTLASARCVLIYGRNRRRLCPVQCGRVVASTSARSYVEQRLVSTVCIAVISYTKNWTYVCFAASGSWIGAY